MYRAMALRGDYRPFAYRGDPGIFSGLGRVVGALGRAAVSVGIGGPIATAAARLGRGAAPAAPAFSFTGAGATQIPTIRPGTAGPAVVGVSPRGTLGIDITPESWRGYHQNKSGYHLRDGTWVAPRSRMVRNRHANYGNARALKRGLRRAFGFRKLATSVMSFTLTGRKRGPARFKAKAGRGR